MSDLLDHSVITELRDIMGDEFGFLIQTFVDDAKAKMELLQRAINEADWEVTFRTAHSLKGSSRNVGAVQLASCLEKLEKNARNQHLDDIPDLYAQAESLLAKSVEQLSA